MEPGSIELTSLTTFIGAIKILGVYFGSSVHPEDNWENKINKINNLLNRWKGRSVTVKGRAIAINCLVSNSLAYQGSILSCPDHLIKKLEDIIWSGRKDKMKRDTVRGPSKMGGTGVVNVDFKLKVLQSQWVTRYAENNSKWTVLFDY